MTVKPSAVDANRWAVVCPECGAEVGKPCFSMSWGRPCVTARPLKRTHGSRLREVRAFLERIGA